jgi:multiple sugar transport system permease protein
MAGQRGLQKWGWVLLFLAPSLVGLLIFTVGPILVSLGLTLFEWNMLSAPEYIGLANFRELFADEAFGRAFQHTLTYIALYIPAVLALALGAAMLLNQNLRGRAFFRTSFFVPVVSSWVVVSLMWQWVFNPRFGLLNYALGLLGISGPAWLFDPNTALYAIIITSIWKDIGFVGVMYLGGLQSIPESLYEAAQIDGARPWQRFRYVTLPLLTPTTFFALIISLINSFQVFDQVWLMPEDSARRGTTVIVEQIVNNAFRYNRIGYAMAMSLVLFVVILGITIVQLRLQNRWVHYELG